MKLQSRNLRIATFNIRGINEITKRQQLDRWVEQKHIDILLLQETKVNHNSTEHGLYTRTFFHTEVDQKKREAVENARQNGKRPSKPQVEASVKKEAQPSWCTRRFFHT